MAFRPRDFLRKLLGPSIREQELEAKTARLIEAVESLKAGYRGMSGSQVEKELYEELTRVFAKAESFDSLFKKALEVFSKRLKARYFGIFWLSANGEAFECRYGKGYQQGGMPLIPRQGSLMGRTLTTQKVLLVLNLAEEKEFLPLRQTPAEYNVLCAPVVMMGKASAVIRLANIDPEQAALARESLETVVPLLSTSLERLLYFGESEKNRKALDAMYAIARLLEDTLEEADIYRKVCAEVPKLFPCAMCFAVRVDDKGESVVTLAGEPQGAWMGGNTSSHAIILRNLVALHEAGTALIPDIHSDRRWAWADAGVKSLCMVPVRRRQERPGYLVAVGPASELYNRTTQSLLGLAASQASLTLERAAHFRVQENLARRDGLTGLLNHRIFQESVREEMERAHRYGHALSLMMVDIDHFKKFNDTYGHPVGDQVICRVAEYLKKQPRTTDRAFRYGGEEFCVLMPETTPENGAHLAERLRKQIEADKTDNLSVTVSIGLTAMKPEEAVQSFIDRADSGLYQSKKAGRNRVSVV